MRRTSGGEVSTRTGFTTNVGSTATVVAVEDAVAATVGGAWRPAVSGRSRSSDAQQSLNGARSAWPEVSSQQACEAVCFASAEQVLKQGPTPPATYSASVAMRVAAQDLTTA